MVMLILVLLDQIYHLSELIFLVHACFLAVTDCPKMNKAEEQVATAFPFISYALKRSYEFRILLAYVSLYFSLITVLANKLAGSTSFAFHFC